MTPTVEESKITWTQLVKDCAEELRQHEVQLKELKRKVHRLRASLRFFKEQELTGKPFGWWNK